MDELGVKSLDFFLQYFLFFSFLKKLVWPLLQSFHDIFFIFFDLFFFLLKLNELWLINEDFVFFLELSSKFSELSLVFAN